jgi:hypothetical protein
MAMTEVKHLIYLIDLKHEDTECLDNIAPTKSGFLMSGAVINTPTKSIFAIAIEDEDDTYHSAFKVQVICE